MFCKNARFYVFEGVFLLSCYVCCVVTWELGTTNQKGKQLIPSAGNHCLALAGSAGRNKKNGIWPTPGFHTTDVRFDRCLFFPGGMLDTIRGSKIPGLVQIGFIYPDSFLCWGVFFPLICCCYLLCCLRRLLIILVFYLVLASPA